MMVDAEPIIPAHGLGGVLLRRHISEYDSKIAGLGIWKPGHYRLVSPYEARYRIEEDFIEIAVDVRNGKVFKVTALPGYKGDLFGQIAIGMPVAAVIDADSRVYYDEASALILMNGVPGVCLDVPVDDPLPEEVIGLEVSAISVFVPEIETAAGNAGNW